MLRGPDSLQPSPQLEKAVRMSIASQAVARQKAQPAATPAAPSHP
jgi:hypothetical protein